MLIGAHFQDVLAATRGRDAKSFRVRGVAFWKLGDVARGRVSLHIARELDPSDPEVHGVLATLELARRNWGAAAVHLRAYYGAGGRYRELQKQWRSLLLARAAVFRRRNDFPRANKNQVLANQLGDQSDEGILQAALKSCGSGLAESGLEALSPHKPLAQCALPEAGQRVRRHRRRALLVGCGTEALAVTLLKAGCYGAAASLFRWAQKGDPKDWRWSLGGVIAALGRIAPGPLDERITNTVFLSERRPAAAMLVAQWLRKADRPKAAGVWAIRAVSLGGGPRVVLDAAELLARVGDTKSANALLSRVGTTP